MTDIIEKECNVCNGNGYVEVGPVCGMPASFCCGGCYENIECENCEGIGRIEDEDYFEET